MTHAGFLQPTRRHLLAGALAGIACAARPGRLHAAVGAEILRRIPQGLLRGRRMDGVDRFLGIPFAAPPVGPLRFRPPQPTVSWQGVRTADGFAPAPMQAPAQPTPYDPHPPALAEDCLYLNVWAPEAPGPHPVYVWVHGGGNVAGASSMPVFDGSAFARAGVVCVTLTYRVGSFGFLELGELLGADYAGSGNNGLRDLIAGLAWVRDAIADFGGDPDRVTLGGQSAGAKNVVALMTIPKAQRLFRRAIVESGGGHTTSTLHAAHDLARRIAASAGLSDPAALLSLPAADLVAAQMRMSPLYPRKYPFRAVLDGNLLAAVPTDAIAAGRARAIPMLIGTTRDENAFFGPAKTPDGHVEQREIANMALADFDAVLARYPAAFPSLDRAAQRYHALTAEEYGIPTLRLARAHAAAGGATWLYRFDLAPESGPHRDLAVHGSELALVWDRLADPVSAMLGPTGPDAARVAIRMHAAWVDFIKGHAPDAWPQFHPARPATMIFDRTPHVDHDVDPVGRSLWKDWRPRPFAGV